ncbi:GLUG motif-containing protein, partial [Stenotrophomonas maltophilia]|uniref:GLUG motif-containing protein n=1 Tax=Stenotrophomonas maltophilia TaxID=40324 RepID=UPI0019545419
AYATGAVKGTRYVGGLVGDNTYGTISQTYATGSVTGANRGGLVGLLSGGTVQSSFWNTTTGPAGGMGMY